MAKSTQVWESIDGSLFKTQKEAEDQDGLATLIAALVQFDNNWNGMQPSRVLTYLLTRFSFSAKP